MCGAYDAATGTSDLGLEVEWDRRHSETALGRGHRHAGPRVHKPVADDALALRRRQRGCSLERAIKAVDAAVTRITPVTTTIYTLLKCR